MDTLNTYLHLFNYFFYSIHPAVFVVGILGLIVYSKKLFGNKLIRFLTILLVFDIGLKSFKFLKTGMLTERYLFITVVIFNIFAAVFIVLGSMVVQKKLKLFIGKYHLKYSIRQIIVFLFGVIIVVMLCQNFNPRFDKSWIKDIAVEIEKTSSGSDRPIILCNAMDERIGYYAKADMLQVNLKNFMIYNNNKYNEKKYYKLIRKPGSVFSFMINLHSLGANNIYFFIAKKSPAYLENIFKVSGNSNPFKLIKVYKSKGKQYCLYQLNVK